MPNRHKKPRLYIRIIKGASRNVCSSNTSVTRSKRSPPSPQTAALSLLPPKTPSNDSVGSPQNVNSSSLGSKLQFLALNHPELLTVVEIMVDRWIANDVGAHRKFGQ